jgi:cell division transport system ATP-binding protein
MPNELSGGEQQRVSLARALVNNPDLIIADEPTGNVDPEMSHEIVDLLTKINNSGTTVVMVTHEHELVRSFQRRVIVIQNGQVVSDTPDPTFAQFKTEKHEEVTDMFYYEEDVKHENVTEVFDNLEEIVSNTEDESIAQAPQGENQEGGEQ